MAELSPMMKQYFAIKEKHKNHILFFRLGDFYEMFFEDAITASRELELTLTGRDCGQEERAPMCGVPFHSCESYIARLVKKGYKVAICEQMENPAAAKGIVKRDVVRVITPGTVLENSMLDEGANNYICCVCQTENGSGLAFADISTGEIHLTTVCGGKQMNEQLKNEISRFYPNEIVFNPEFLDNSDMGRFLKDRISCTADVLDAEHFEYENACEMVLRHFGKDNLQQLSLEELPTAVCALGGLLAYLYDTQRQGLDCLVNMNIYNDSQYMNLDLTARRNLELTGTLRTGEKKGSLLWVLDKTKTAMGKRLIRSYIEKPLVNPTVINNRLNSVDELVSHPIQLDDITESLAHIYDLERLMTRIVFGSVTPRELKSMQYTSSYLPQLQQRMTGLSSRYLAAVREDMDLLEDLCELIDNAICDEPPALLRDGGVIKAGYSEELDQLRDVVSNSKEYLAKIEADERERTGIKNLKIGFNKVFGYYLEVTKSYQSLVPAEYIRKQTLANCERYITQELKELEQTILGAGDRITAIEQRLYDEVRKTIAQQLHRVQKTAGLIARLDVLCSFARVAVQNNYCRPMVDLSGVIEIQDGRHPVVEMMLTDSMFVANDVHLNLDDDRVAIITGPNMAGKSTYMRQTALIVLMAQIGCFVPARSATIGVVDGIFTRIGASDDLSSGQSTFMVEMSEVAHILTHATKRSLLILDEIGRGTSTFDGMSIARAVIEHIASKKKLGAKTLFATHYHELTSLEDELDGVKNYNIAVKRKGEDVIFLRRIVRGGTDDSFGIYVSKLAGIPDSVVNRADKILKALEAGQTVFVSAQKSDETAQMTLTVQEDHEVIRRLKAIDIDELSPRQAFNILEELKRLV